eukprot:CAMPEP_0167754498 /NCGR_PEP_ID=MMETSP0110_2-20121227/8299_1 /TAXON_ID=629695 /ORGANISM="Gymnochlora sp., Strain CCMP2014" /LENGTH=2366 /DNA_ID=CAMNT_0007640375 /DNA_START=9 /DNA_END=7109 /DNA_ORIENTATION=+
MKRRKSPKAKGEKDTLTIVGRAANPLNKENWEGDFDIPHSLDLKDTLRNPLPNIQRGKSMENLDDGVTFENFGEDDDFFKGFGDGDTKGIEQTTTAESGTSEMKDTGETKAEESDGEDWDAIAAEQAGEEDGFGSGFRDSRDDGGGKGEIKVGDLKDDEGFGDFDSGSDWDKAFEEEDGEDGKFVSLELDDNDDAEEVDDIKSRSLLTQLTSNKSHGRYNIVTYPEAPSLYSKKVPGAAQMAHKDKNMAAFLQSLAISSRVYQKQPNSSFDSFASSVSRYSEEKTKKGRTHKKSKSRNTSNLSDSKSPRLEELFPRVKFTANPKDILPTILQNCHKLVKDEFTENPEHIAVLVEDCCRYIQSHLDSPNISSYKDDPKSAELMYNMLFAASHHHQLHPSLIRTALVCFPDYSPMFSLLKFECKAHHDGSVADLWIRSFCKMYSEQGKLIKELSKSKGSGDGKKERKKPGMGTGSALRTSVRLRVAYQTQARALASLHLYLDNRSPIDWKELSQDAQYDPLEDANFEWLLNAFEGKPLGEGIDEQGKLTYELCGNDVSRMKRLQDVYGKVEFETLAKAHAAFALAKYLSEGNLHEVSGFSLDIKGAPRTESTSTNGISARLSENLAFECITILEKLIKREDNATPYFRSQMGVSSLVLFGQILNANSKYEYAVHAFESAIKIFHAVYGVSYFEMINTLSTLCEKHDDWKRALKYHLIILDKAKVEGNLNLYVYIVQQISKIHTKAGDFLNAVKHLRSAIEVLNQCIKMKEVQGSAISRNAIRGFNNALDIHKRNLARLHNLQDSNAKRVDFFPGVHMQEVSNQKVNLYLRLAQHFLDAKRIIEAIVVLEFLLEEEGKLPRGKISVVHLLLATAYTKKRLYRCARELISHMHHIANEKKNAPTFNIPGTEHVSFNAEFTPILGVSPSEVIKTREFWALCAKTEYNLGNFSNSTLYTRILMRMSTSTSWTLGQRGKLHYRMGKILQGIMFRDLIKLNLGKDKHEITKLPDIRECMKQFDQAYTYFDKIVDQVHIAKTLIRIVETYLHVAFTTVGLLAQSFTVLDKWLESAGFRPESLDPQETKEEVSLRTWKNFLSKIERPAFDSLNVTLQTFNPILYLKCLINVAEIRFLQGKYEASLKYWRECKNTFFTIAMNSERCVMVDRATPAMTGSIHSVFRRLVRLLVCFHPDMINRNLVLLDSYNLHVIELYAEVEQCSPLRLWPGTPRSPRTPPTNNNTKKRTSKDSGQRALRKQRMLQMRGGGMREDVDLFMNNDTEVMLETRRWLRQRKTPEPLTQEKHWRKHLSAFMGAVGSRSMSKSLHHDLAGSMMYDNYLDRESYKKAIELRDTVCSLFYQISLNFGQSTAGRFSTKQLEEKNRADLAEIVKNMDQLRSLTYNKSGRQGGIASAVSPLAGPSAPRDRKASLGTSRRPSSVWMSEFGNTNNRSVSRGSDPLWSNLTYCIPLGSAVILYSPQLKAKLIRMVNSGKQLEGQPFSVRMDPEFLSKTFDEFVSRQAQLRKFPRQELRLSKRDDKYRARELEILRVGRKFGMLHDPSANDSECKVAIISSKHPINQRIIEETEQENEADVDLKDIDLKLEDGATAINEIKNDSLKSSHSDAKETTRERLPSSQFLVDESNEDHKVELETRESVEDKRKDRAASLYDVFEEVQGLKSNTAMKTTEDIKDTKQVVVSPVDKSQTNSPPTVKLEAKQEIPDIKDLRAKIFITDMQVAVSCKVNPGITGAQESTKFTLEIYSSREKLLEIPSEKDSKWPKVKFRVTCSNERHPLWFVVKRSVDTQSSRVAFVGQKNILFSDLKKFAKDHPIVLEDKSDLHSQGNLFKKAGNSPGMLIFHEIRVGPRQRFFRDDSLVQSLTFPERKYFKSLDAKNNEMMDKLIPPSFDIMLIKELLAALDRQNILALLSGMFNECQIILTSQNNFRLKAAINCLLRLMYPFQWQHTLVPLLPRSCVGMLALKQPYIIAVNQFVFPSCIDLIPQKAIVAFLDHNQIRIRPGSFVPFPSSVKNRLSTAIQQFRVMLFRSLVTNKDAPAAPRKARSNNRLPVNKINDSGGHMTTASSSANQIEQRYKAGAAIQGSNPASPEEKTSMASYRLSQKMLAYSTSARPEISLGVLKRHFLECFVSMFYKIRLNWTGNPSQPLDVRGFLSSTRPEYLPFIDSFVRTKSFGTFIELRSELSIDEHSTLYLFDDMVYRTIYEKLVTIKSLHESIKKGRMLCQKGRGRWKMRSVEIIKNKLNVYKINARKGAKYTRILKPGWFQIEIPQQQNGQNYYAFELRNAYDAQKDDSTLTFRVSSESEREAWIRAISVRIMDSQLRWRYEFIASKFGGRFAQRQESTMKSEGKHRRSHSIKV